MRCLQKCTALLVVRVSNLTIEDGMGIISNKVAKTSHWELQTTTLIPATFKSSNMAPSKLVFHLPESGGFHTTC